MTNKTTKVTSNKLDYYLLMRPYGVNTCKIDHVGNVWDLKKVYLIYMLSIRV